MIRVCVAGCTGVTGSLVTKYLLNSAEFKLTGAIARTTVGQDIGEVLLGKKAGILVSLNLEDVLKQQDVDVLIDYTRPDSVKKRVLYAINAKLHVVIGTSGLSADDFSEIEQSAQQNQVGVIAAGNFSLTAALAKHFSLIAAQYIHSYEVIDYAKSSKPDAPSGTVRELAEALSKVAQNKLDIPIADTLGIPATRGATIGATQVHSIRLPGFVISFETLFGMPNERLTIRHDAGSGADPYVSGTFLAVKKVMQVKGLVRGLDKLLF